MELSTEELQEIFVAPGHMSEEDFERAVAIAATERTPIEIQFSRLDLLSDYHIGKSIADAKDLPFCDLASIAVEDLQLSPIPEVVARAQQAIAYKETADALFVATLHPDNFEFRKLLMKKTGKRIEFSYPAHGALSEALKAYKGDYADRIAEQIEQCMRGEDEHSIVAFVDLLLEYGYSSNASDIHIEPLPEVIAVRFRIDGVLHEVIRYPKALHQRVSFRIKILARLQTDEQGRAQDGRFTYAFSDESFDTRVSVMPTTDGENIVLRLLSSHNRQFTLETIGFSDEDRKKVERALAEPHGLILVVGPTGSGKSSVLYTMLAKLNDHRVNIMTIEDPVEYDIEHVQQSQVNPSKDLSFANGLRSIVRQDPDIIMVGEIRDEETADIAVNAAMTGHLLLSTLHTNDAATTFPRLSEMSVEPFLVASSTRLVVSVRLVRSICKHCKSSHFLSKQEQILIDSAPEVAAQLRERSGKKDIGKIRFYRGSGCKACSDTGFTGRRAIFEVMEVSDELRALIAKNATADELQEVALAEGMRPLLFDGIEKALKGVTTMAEVIHTVYV